MSRRSIVLLLVLGFPAVPSADVVPLGSEQVVATTADADYSFYSPDSAPQGSGFVVTWTSAFSRYGASELVDWGAAVHGRRIAADGRPEGGLLPLVPEAHKLDIHSSAVAADAAGRFAVVWSSAREGHNQVFVQLRRFSPSGQTLSTVLADRFGSGFYRVVPAVVAMGAAGRTLAVWGQPRRSPATVFTFAGLFGRVFLPSGQPLLPRFQATTRPVSEFVPAALGTDARGNAVLVYENQNDGASSTLYLRSYDRDGRDRGVELRLAGRATAPALAVHPGGRFVVAWQGAGGIRARLFDPPYRALGPAIRITTGRGAFPDVAVGPDGRFVVAWMEPEPATPGAARIMARGFDPLGAPLGEAFRVDQQYVQEAGVDSGLGPTVAAAESGTFLISWIAEERAGFFSRVVSRLYGVTDAGG